MPSRFPLGPFFKRKFKMKCISDPDWKTVLVISLGIVLFCWFAVSAQETEPPIVDQKYVIYTFEDTLQATDLITEIRDYLRDPVREIDQELVLAHLTTQTELLQSIDLRLTAIANNTEKTRGAANNIKGTINRISALINFWNNYGQEVFGLDYQQPNSP